MVVVPEHGHDRNPDIPTGVREHERLLGLALSRQVARQQDQVDLVLDGVERTRDSLTQRLGAVKVTRSGKSDRLLGHDQCFYPRARFRERASWVQMGMGYTPSENFPRLIETMKRACAALDAAEVPVMLGGGMAVWAMGGPPSDHDVDFYLREEDAQRATDVLAAEAMDVSVPPEGWLLKAHDDGILVDLIFRPAGGPIGDEHFERATLRELMAQPVLVASINDVLVTKLLALSEQEPDFRSVLELVRALREQIDWEFVTLRTASSPFAAAFFTLVEALGIAPLHSGRADGAEIRRAHGDRIGLRA